MPESNENFPFLFKSNVASKVFDSLIDSFIEDYMLKKYIAEKSGWRTLAEIANKIHVSQSLLYGKTSTVGPALDEPLRRGLVEKRIFPGERGRGGEVLRLRITYEKDPIKELVSQRVRLAKKSVVLTSDPLEEKVTEVLLQSSLLGSLQKDQITRIVHLAEKPFFSPNEFIIREGDISSGFFIIIDGQAEAKQRGRTIRRMGRGQFFGETSLSEHQIRSADVIAVQPTLCLKVNTAQLKELINLDPQIAVKLLEETMRRTREMERISSAVEREKEKSS